jgi:hypothetical protein
MYIRTFKPAKHWNKGVTIYCGKNEMISIKVLLCNLGICVYKLLLGGTDLFQQFPTRLQPSLEGIAITGLDTLFF